MSSQDVSEVDPSCYITLDVSTVKNGKYSSSCYNVKLPMSKFATFFVSSQSLCEVIPIYVDVVHVTTECHCEALE